MCDGHSPALQTRKATRTEASCAVCVRKGDSSLEDSFVPKDCVPLVFTVVLLNITLPHLLLSDLYLYAKNCLKGEYLEVFLKRARDCLLDCGNFSDSEPDNESECEPPSSSRPSK